MKHFNQNFEDFIKKEVDNFEAIPSEKVWDKLANDLPQTTPNISNKPNWVLFAATILSGIILLSLLFLYLKNESKPAVQPAPTRVYARYQSTDIFQIQQIKNAVELMEREDKKLVLVNCQMSSCPMCTKMEAVTYENPEIAAFIQKHFVKIDVEFTKSEITQLQDIYGLKSYPTALFLDRDGVLLDKVVGFQTPAIFLETLDNMMELEAMGDLVYN